MRKKLSKNFFADEFECQCGCGVGTMDPEFIAVLQSIRDEFNKPMFITSGLRCLAHNSKVGGSPRSRHLIGIAADIAVASSGDYYRLMQLALKHELQGVGIGDGYIHLDMRSSSPVLLTYY